MFLPDLLVQLRIAKVNGNTIESEQHLAADGVWTSAGAARRTLPKPCAATTKWPDLPGNARRSASAILEIKQGLIARGQYGFDKAPIHFHSPEIYAAVVEKGARSLKDFLALCLD